MPSPEEIRALIQKLQNQGLSREEIAETLSDMGIDPSSLMEASSIPSQPQEASQAPSASTPALPQQSDDDLFVTRELSAPQSSPSSPAPTPQKPSEDDDLFNLKAQIVGAPKEPPPTAQDAEQPAESAPAPADASTSTSVPSTTPETPPIPAAPQVQDVLSSMLGAGGEGEQVSPSPDTDASSSLLAPDDQFASPATSAQQSAPVAAAAPASPAPPSVPSTGNTSEPFHATVATPPLVEEEDRRLSEIHEKVHEIHSAVASGNLSDEIAEINDLLHEVASDVKELKAMYSAIQRILQQILETDRSLLVNLYEDARKKR